MFHATFAQSRQVRFLPSRLVTVLLIYSLVLPYFVFSQFSTLISGSAAPLVLALLIVWNKTLFLEVLHLGPPFPQRTLTV